MHRLKLFLIFLFLINACKFTYAFSSNFHHSFSDQEVNFQFSEDISALSPGHLPSTEKLLKVKVNTPFTVNIIGENIEVSSREIAYLSTHRLIIPGLSLPEIIFPFSYFSIDPHWFYPGSITFKESLMGYNYWTTEFSVDIIK